MTNNKWLKNTAREVAAHTGISYASARRQVLEVADREGIPYSAAGRLLIAAADAEPGGSTTDSTEGEQR